MFHTYRLLNEYPVLNTLVTFLFNHIGLYILLRNDKYNYFY
jgi:hypothetical protein